MMIVGMGSHIFRMDLQSVGFKHRIVFMGLHSTDVLITVIEKVKNTGRRNEYHRWRNHRRSIRRSLMCYTNTKLDLFYSERLSEKTFQKPEPEF